MILGFNICRYLWILQNF